ncbi:hypothetical protein QFZ98_003613 [Paraburkholderia youngii]
MKGVFQSLQALSRDGMIDSANSKSTHERLLPQQTLMGYGNPSPRGGFVTDRRGQLRRIRVFTRSRVRGAGECTNPEFGNLSIHDDIHCLYCGSCRCLERLGGAPAAVHRDQNVGEHVDLRVSRVVGIHDRPPVRTNY